MPTTPRRRNAPLAAFDPDPHGLLSPVGAKAGGTASHRFRVQRPRDLVNLQVTAYGCELARVGGQVVLRAAGDKARLEVRLPFQHLGEESFLEGEKASARSLARAAEGSRLVFALGQDVEPVPYSVEGVLGALGRLPLVVVPLAAPRPATADPDRLVLAVLDGGVALVREPSGLVLDRLSATERRTYAPGGTSDLVLARQVLARESAVDRTKGAVPALAELLVPVPRRPVMRSKPRRPRSDETALEAPYRLVLSPSALGGFAHSATPVEHPGGRVELWHSRLGVRVERDGVVHVDEQAREQRIVRAVWTRDDDSATGPDEPFQMPLDATDRRAIVRQSSDPTSPTPVEPVAANRLAVSALGATLDLTATWKGIEDVEPEVLSWDHRAPLGRDQLVKVVYPGYLFPLGVRAALVKQTTRRVQSPGSKPVARLITEYFLVIADPVRGYADHEMPFREVRVGPLHSPGLQDPEASDLGHGRLLFWPRLLTGEKLPFVLECLDHDGQRTRLSHPLLFVGQRYDAKKRPRTPPNAEVVAAWEADGTIEALDQRIAFAPSGTPGDTSLQTARLRLTGTPVQDVLRCSPRVTGADVVIPAVQAVAPPNGVGATSVEWAPAYRTGGFAADAVAEQFLSVVGSTELDFTQGSDRGGGFLAPNLAVQGLSRLHGAMGDPAGYAGGGFDPVAAFGSLLPKLFGVFALTDLLKGLPSTEIPVPALVATALDEVAQVKQDLEQLHAQVDAAATRLAAEAQRSPTKGMADAAAAAEAVLSGVVSGLGAAVTALPGALTALAGGDAQPFLDVTAGLRDQLTALKAALAGVTLPAAVRASVERPLDALLPPLADVDALAIKAASFMEGLQGLGGLAEQASYTWSTQLADWPDPGDGALFVAEDGDRRAQLSLGVVARPSGPQAGVDVSAELTDFALSLFPETPLIAVEFDRLAFHAATGRKADVDVVFRGIEFQGVLGFVNTLKELIPFDGFSDPPYLDVDEGGLRAGFDLALPSVGIGVFSLENVALHAGLELPFLGEALTVGFAFCSREKPFRLTVMAIGGGGFVGMTLSPKGLVVLEMSLEAAACLSVSLGVASGSVSVSVGVYLRLEDQGGSLTGYFRIRGEVDVLGLISASITLELALTYDFDSGKMIGRASVEIEVEVFLLSTTVTVSCERRLAGSNGDPTYADVLTLDPATGTAPEWDAYCAAFAAV